MKQASTRATASDHEAQAAELIGLAKLFSFEVEHGEKRLGSMKQRVRGKCRNFYSKSTRADDARGPAGREARPCPRPCASTSCRRDAGDRARDSPLDRPSGRPARSSPTPRRRRRVRARLGRLDFENQHVPSRTDRRAGSRNDDVSARDRSDRLSVEDEGDESPRPGPSAEQDLAAGSRRRAAEPASQDRAASGRPGPSGSAGSAVAPRIRASPAARHPQPPRSRIRCSVTRLPSSRGRADTAAPGCIARARRQNFRIHSALVWSSLDQLIIVGISLEQFKVVPRSLLARSPSSRLPGGAQSRSPILQSRRRK